MVNIIRTTKTFNCLLTNKSFISFLIHQVQGVFKNFNCNHLSPPPCHQCVQEFIKHSEFKHYFKNLYDWFMKENFQSVKYNLKYSDSLNSFDLFDQEEKHLLNNIYFYPKNILYCFKSIHYYLKKEGFNYFCSPWLDSLNNNNYKPSNIFIIFKSLCEYGHLETLKWLYNYKKQNNIVFNKHQRQEIFNTICQQNPNQNTKTPQILLWLFTLEFFKKNDILPIKDEGFSKACQNGNIELIKLLLELTKDQKIKQDTINELGFWMAYAFGHIEVIRFLLRLEGDRQVHKNTINGKVFKMACSQSQCVNLEVVKLLLEVEDDRRISGYTINEEAFRTACEKGNLELIRLLLKLEKDRKIKKNIIEENILRACNSGNSKLIGVLLSTLKKY